MSLLYPLGLIALIGIIVLIIIYIIKPNYQTKFVSSTFVWKLSLKYRKKKLPTSRLRNILLIICQVLILTLLSLIIAYPIYRYQQEKQQDETILVIDSSSSMRTEYDNVTRFERAIEKAKQLSDQTIAEGGVMTILIASENPSTLVEKYGEERKNEIIEELDLLVESAETDCSYAKADVDKAFDMCDDLLTKNPTAKVIFYTDTKYSYVPKNVTVERIFDETEKNFAILDAYVTFTENYYDISVELQAYGYEANAVAKEVEVSIVVDGANAKDKNDNGQILRFSKAIQVEPGYKSKLIFKGSESGLTVSSNTEIKDLSDAERFSSFSSITVTIDEEDSYSLDDHFYIYGGQKEVIKIQYSSDNPNIFVNGVLYTIQNYYADTYDIQITEEKHGKPELKGFDYYIFEHKIPDKLPTDGVCLIFDPLSSPTNGGYNAEALLGDSSTEIHMEVDDGAVDHPLIKDIKVDNLFVTKYVKVSYDESYTPLVNAAGSENPLLLFKDNGNSKIFLMNFSVHYSNLVVSKEFPFLLNNIIKYYTPSIIESNAYEIGDTVSFNTRGQTLELVEPDGTKTSFESFPASIVVNKPESYTISQNTYFGKEITETFYVRTPKSESDIFAVEDALKDLYYEDTIIDLYDDLVLYFAAALVALEFFEWWLKNRDRV